MLIRLASLLLLPLTLFADQQLADHPSSYLRSHADDAIEWRIPGEAALSEARRRNLPLFVSSGYLACYWCYRLKSETFRDPEFAARVNAAFVPVLLDREVHTEDDRRLQAFMNATLGISGWPIMVVMTPDSVPFKAWPYTATAALSEDIQTISNAWTTDAEQVRGMAAENFPVSKIGNDAVKHPDPVRPGELGDLLAAFLDQTSKAADGQHGGFGTDAKYPYVPQLQALLDLNQLNPSPAMSAFLRHSLDNMIAGELLDPVEGGAFRYVENVDWTAPHFEQMLYTQALLARLLIRAASALSSPRYAATAERILDNLLGRFAAADGTWFVASLSAVGSDGVNGGYYLYSTRELSAGLGDNWPSLVAVRRQYGDRMMVEPIGPLAAVTGQALESIRGRRTLQRDEKRLLAWNGLALSALSHGAALGESYHRAARDLAVGIMAATEDGIPGKLVDHSPQLVPPDLDTLVYAAGGLMDWWQVSGDSGAVGRAVSLLEWSRQGFHDSDGWRRSRPLLFPDSAATAAIPDEQLPSVSAEWLRIATTLQAAGVTLPAGINRVVDDMAEAWPASLANAAFFNATLVGALVTRRFIGIN